MSLIKLLLPQQRPRVTVRNLINRAGKALQELKPCFMMGPQAVAQYLTPGNIEFDIVIMDEASQLKPEYAVGAIARGKQLVVVGDSNQLPPTNFFNRMNDGTDEDGEETITESESILDLCRSQFKAVKKLLWHYRSQHHSLIAFSNLKFYDNELLVFPSPREQSESLGLSALYLKDAVYENQVNKKEAIAVAELLIQHILKKSNDSIGVVTLNIKQKELITEIFETKKLEYIDDNDVWEHWNKQAEPVFIKNLENVQGDERDCIIISTTYGKAPGTTAVRQNFGPISKPDGWRRLNVLFTRARKSITVVTSLLPSDIITTNALHDGSKVLQQYLTYIQTGVLDQGVDTGLEPESEFEKSVIKVLKRNGFEVMPQLGVAGYRIDIAVKDPNRKNAYIAAIECDGARFHSAKSARDRDRIRQEVLESLGWKDKIWRIWSTDWYRNPEAETEKMISFLSSLKSEYYPSPSSQPWLTISENGHTSDHDTVVSEQELSMSEIDETISQLEEKEVVEVGDTIIYQDQSRPDKDLEVTITLGKPNEEKRIIARKTPLATTLLKAAVGDEVKLELNNGTFKVFLVKEIRKPKESDDV
jgi:very-short-patch-repair endonuclease